MATHLRTRFLSHNRWPHTEQLGELVNHDASIKVGAIVRKLIIAFLLSTIGPTFGTEVTDGDTMLVKDTVYRLDGIDAPQTDQVCLDDNGNAWACGIGVRDQLRTFIGKRDVQCVGKKSDPDYRNRFIAICRVEGEAVSLNQW